MRQLSTKRFAKRLINHTTRKGLAFFNANLFLISIYFVLSILLKYKWFSTFLTKIEADTTMPAPATMQVAAFHIFVVSIYFSGTLAQRVV